MLVLVLALAVSVVFVVRAVAVDAVAVVVAVIGQPPTLDDKTTKQSQLGLVVCQVRWSLQFLIACLRAAVSFTASPPTLSEFVLTSVVL